MIRKSHSRSRPDAQGFRGHGSLPTSPGGRRIPPPVKSPKAHGGRCFLASRFSLLISPAWRLATLGLVFAGCARAPSGPDFVVYHPQTWDGLDSTNEHFLVVPVRSGAFLAFWTQASVENNPDQRIVMSRSLDRGRTWSPPVTLAGDPTGESKRLASWAFPFVVPATGRVYLFWNQNVGIVDAREDTTGTLTYCWSDDEGATWSPRHTLPIRKSAISHPDPKVPENWVTFQCPIITSRKQVLVGFTRWASKAFQPVGGLFERHSELGFLRFDNILTEPDGSKLRVTTLPESDHGPAVPWPEKPKISIAQEPAIQELADGRLITVMRTRTGYIYFTLSADEGRSWSPPQPLRFAPGGEKIPQPLAPCPLYKLRDGRFLLIFHNNTGHANGGTGPTDSRRVRRPVFISVGREIPDRDQPIRFSPPRLLADNGGQPHPVNGHTQIGTYPSLFEFQGRIYFWYPDRKHILYGMILPRGWIDAMTPKG
ncbi:MAG: hypothetical protein AMXMBFR83_05430 [Phycisphaerae bacterium]